ncbi:MAG: hypothetical protein ACXACC_07440 [Promethearchaeota archaeon]|jgi:hypothetical protein
MTEEEPPRPKGLPIGTIAPLFETTDIYGNQISLLELLTNYTGVLIDFFRGNW